MATIATDLTTDPRGGQATDLPEFFEVVDGEIVEYPPMGLDEGLLANEIKRFLDAYLGHHPLGRALTEILFDLRPAVNRSRRPDAAFVSYQRWPRGKRLGSGIAMPAAPEIAAEVVSPGDGAADLIDKIHEYFAAGCRLVWVVYPGVEQVYVYDSAASVRILGRTESLDGGEVLPGFMLSLAELFGPPEPSGTE